LPGAEAAEMPPEEEKQAEETRARARIPG